MRSNGLLTSIGYFWRGRAQQSGSGRQRLGALAHTTLKEEQKTVVVLHTTAPALLCEQKGLSFATLCAAAGLSGMSTHGKYTMTFESRFAATYISLFLKHCFHECFIEYGQGGLSPCALFIGVHDKIAHIPIGNAWPIPRIAPKRSEKLKSQRAFAVQRILNLSTCQIATVHRLCPLSLPFAQPAGFQSKDQLARRGTSFSGRILPKRDGPLADVTRIAQSQSLRGPIEALFDPPARSFYLSRRRRRLARSPLPAPQGAHSRASRSSYRSSG